MNIDMNAARAARAAEAEAKKEPKTITWGDKTYSLPNEMPYDSAEEIARGMYRAALVSLLGQEAWDEIHALVPSVNDMSFLMDNIADVYGFPSLGESAASPG